MRYNASSLKVYAARRRLVSVTVMQTKLHYIFFLKTTSKLYVKMFCWILLLLFSLNFSEFAGNILWSKTFVAQCIFYFHARKRGMKIIHCAVCTLSDVSPGDLKLKCFRKLLRWHFEVKKLFLRELINCAVRRTAIRPTDVASFVQWSISSDIIFHYVLSFPSGWAEKLMRHKTGVRK